MNKKIGSILLLISFTFFGYNLSSQTKYWINLKDKVGTPYSVSNPSAFLTQKSIARRTMYNIAVDQTDLPVNPSYLNQIQSIPSVTILYASKWMNGVAVSVPAGASGITAMSAIYALSCVADTHRVKKYQLRIPQPGELDKFISTSSARGSSTTSSDSALRSIYGGSFWQNKQLDLLCLHEKGYKGQGMTIAVLDAGFYFTDTNPVFDSLRKRGGLLGTRNFVNGGTDVYTANGTHGTSVLSCMAGNLKGIIQGSAPEADYWLLNTEDGSAETPSEEYNWIRGAEFADSVGVDILTTSLGYTTFDPPFQNHTYATLDGKTAPMSIASTMAARKGLFVLNAAGNEGGGAWNYISVAGDADSICTVGAVDSAGIVANFSGVGPTFDNRIKPDLVARGVGSWISVAGTPCFPGNGTSFATPILAGAVACFWQGYRQYNNMKVLDTLRKGASNAATPNNSAGWGMPRLCPIPTFKFFSGKATLSDKTVHTGIKVKFMAKSVTANTDSTTTDADGNYSINLSLGNYEIVYSKFHYQDEVEATTFSATTNFGTTVLYPLPVLSGKALLSDKSDHTGIKVKFVAKSATANSDSTYTTADGSFSNNLKPGNYEIVYSKYLYIDQVKTTTFTSAFSIETTVLQPVPNEVFDFTAYADKVTSELTIFLSRGAYTIESCTIYDILGRPIISLDTDKITTTTLSFGASILSDEVYIIKIKTSEGTRIKKFIKL